MGRGFLAVHHYCWGLINTRRALAPGVKPVIRTGLLQSVVGDYMFVIHNSPRDFVLLPEIWMRIGETQLLRSQPELPTTRSLERAKSSPTTGRPTPAGPPY